MALPASTIRLFKDQPCQLHGCSLLRARNHQISPTCSIKLTRRQFSGPNKVKMQMNNARERRWDAMPNSVQKFPWKKAEDIVLQRLMFLGKKALKWSLITLFTFSFFSDVIFSISRNKELMIPFGLFIGCMMTDFLKETSRELFHYSEDRNLSRHLLGISCFFVLVKFVSAYFVVRGRIFLLHVANGGLMQVLWLWKSLLEERDTDNGENSFLHKNASTGMDAEG